MSASSFNQSSNSGGPCRSSLQEVLDLWEEHQKTNTYKPLGEAMRRANEYALFGKIKRKDLPPDLVELMDH